MQLLLANYQIPPGCDVPVQCSQNSCTDAFSKKTPRNCVLNAEKLKLIRKVVLVVLLKLIPSSTLIQTNTINQLLLNHYWPFHLNNLSLRYYYIVWNCFSAEFCHQCSWFDWLIVMAGEWCAAASAMEVDLASFASTAAYGSHFVTVEDLKSPIKGTVLRDRFQKCWFLVEIKHLLSGKC
jgi:hypothetical protein